MGKKRHLWGLIPVWSLNGPRFMKGWETLSGAAGEWQDCLQPHRVHLIRFLPLKTNKISFHSKPEQMKKVWLFNLSFDGSECNLGGQIFHQISCMCSALGMELLWNYFNRIKMCFFVGKFCLKISSLVNNLYLFVLKLVKMLLFKASSFKITLKSNRGGNNWPNHWWMTPDWQVISQFWISFWLSI